MLRDVAFFGRVVFATIIRSGVSRGSVDRGRQRARFGPRRLSYVVQEVVWMFVNELYSGFMPQLYPGDFGCGSEATSYVGRLVAGLPKPCEYSKTPAINGALFVCLLLRRVCGHPSRRGPVPPPIRAPLQTPDWQTGLRNVLLSCSQQLLRRRHRSCCHKQCTNAYHNAQQRFPQWRKTRSVCHNCYIQHALNMSSVQLASLVLRPLLFQYWRYEFPSILSSTRLVPYVVLATEPLPQKVRPTAPRGHRIRKARVADVELARECDLGRNDDRVHAVSHLGHILRAGDTVLGYDVSSANLPEGEANALVGSLPDVVLVRKVYPRTDADGAGKRDRNWKLGELEKDGGDTGGGVSAARDEASAERDYERFLQQLESDKDMRRQVNLYKSGDATATAAAATEGGMEVVEEMDEEEVRLEELLDSMTLDNANAGPDEADDLGATATIYAAAAAPAPNTEALPSLEDDPDL